MDGILWMLVWLAVAAGAVTGSVCLAALMFCMVRWAVTGRW